MDFYKKNIELLAKFQPGLANRVKSVSHPENVTTVSAKTGHPIPQVQSISLHSQYKPLEEAQKMVNEFEVHHNRQSVIYGLGFGYHVLEILKKDDRDLIVIEPMITVFRAFMSCVDLAFFLPRVRFLVGESPPKILNRHKYLNWNIFFHKPSVQISKSYFEWMDQCKRAEEFIQKNRLRVLVVNPIYGGSLPTAHHCTEALRNLGHEVCPVNSEDFADSFHAVREITKIKKNNEILSNRFMQFMNEIVLAKAAEFKPDLVLALAQAPLSPEGITRLKELKMPVAFWFVEDYRTLTYWKDVAPYYDYFFTIQQSGFFDELKSIGVNNYYYLPQACNPSVHKPLNMEYRKSNPYASELSFMGAAYYNRVQSFQRLLDFDLKIWGSGWDSQSILGKYIQNTNDRVSTDDCVKIYNSTKVNLNLHSSSFHEGVNPNGDFVNPRTYEIASCEGFQLVDDRSELVEMFDAGSEMVTFNSIEDLKGKVQFYLDHEDERRRIAENSRQRVLRDHTFEKRLCEMLNFIFYNRLEELKSRLDARSKGVKGLLEQAGEDTELGHYLEPFKNQSNFKIKTLIDHIEDSDGNLTKNELLLLMVDQVVREGEDMA